MRAMGAEECLQCVWECSAEHEDLMASCDLLVADRITLRDQDVSQMPITLEQ